MVTNQLPATAELHLEVHDPHEVHLDHTHMLAVDEGPGTKGRPPVILFG